MEVFGSVPVHKLVVVLSTVEGLEKLLDLWISVFLSGRKGL